jgi:hypothetical protein
MNDLAAEQRGIQWNIFSCSASGGVPACRLAGSLIYPDTLRYRDSFNLQISMHFVFEI